MSRISEFKAISAQVRTTQRNCAAERSKRSMALYNSEQYKFLQELVSAMDGDDKSKVQDSCSLIETAIETAVNSAFDPVAIFEDTLRSIGYRQGQIHKQVTLLYNKYLGDDTGLGYEDMIGPVADYVYLNQHLYDTFDPNKL